MSDEVVTFDKKQFLEFIEWVGVKGEIATTDSGVVSFNFEGNMGNTFELEVKNDRKTILDKIESCLLECSHLDERINGEGGCLGTRNGERNCDKCRYFDVDVSCLKSTIEELRG